MSVVLVMLRLLLPCLLLVVHQPHQQTRRIPKIVVVVDSFTPTFITIPQRKTNHLPIRRTTTHHPDHPVVVWSTSSLQSQSQQQPPSVGNENHGNEFNNPMLWSSASSSIDHVQQQPPQSIIGGWRRWKMMWKRLWNPLVGTTTGEHDSQRVLYSGASLGSSTSSSSGSGSDDNNKSQKIFNTVKIQFKSLLRRIQRLHDPITYIVVLAGIGYKLDLFRNIPFLLFSSFFLKWYRARYILKIPLGERQPAWNNIVTSRDQEKELKAFTCKNCGSTIFVAKSREDFFYGPRGIGGLGCYTCGAKGVDNFIMDRDRIVEDVGDLDNDYEYEKPLNFVSASEKRQLLKECGGDEEKANALLLERTTTTGGNKSTPGTTTTEDESAATASEIASSLLETERSAVDGDAIVTPPIPTPDTPVSSAEESAASVGVDAATERVTNAETEATERVVNAEKELVVDTESELVSERVPSPPSTASSSLPSPPPSPPPPLLETKESQQPKNTIQTFNDVIPVDDLDLLDMDG